MSGTMMLARLKDTSSAQLIAVARQIAEIAFDCGAGRDDDDAYPTSEFDLLREHGFIKAPLRPCWGGIGLGSEPRQAGLTAEVLMTVGWGSLPLGRLYEGHVNALRLLQDHGRPSQIDQVKADVNRGCVFGVWNTDGEPSVQLIAADAGYRLSGRKIFASGSGHIDRPLITARKPNGELLMVVPRDMTQTRADLSTWKAHGMRASASGAFDFSDMSVSDEEIYGVADGYHQQPAFSAGAWRFCAVQLGGIIRLLDEVRFHLVRSGRSQDVHQQTRVGLAAIASQGARQWVEGAAIRAESADKQDAESIVSYVNLARLAVERAGLDVIECAQRSVGLAGFDRAHPMERIMRDLATYLRQPAPDRALISAASYVLNENGSAIDLWRSDEGQ